jgi:hypothetical protein
LPDERTPHCQDFAKWIVEVDVDELRADVRKVKRLDTESMLPRSFDLQLPEALERIARGSCELLCLLQRDTAHVDRRGARVL